MVPFPMTLNEPQPVFKVTPLFDAKYLTATDTAIVTIEGEWETASKLVNGISFNDLEISKPHFKVTVLFNVKLLANGIS